MHYNTDINIIGSIPDYHLIHKALPLLISDTDNLKKLLVTDNEFGFRAYVQIVSAFELYYGVIFESCLSPNSH